MALQLGTRLGSYEVQSAIGAGVGEVYPPEVEKVKQRLDGVGGLTDIRVDGRIVGATNRNLAAEGRAGRFRENLFYRLLEWLEPADLTGLHLASRRPRGRLRLPIQQ